MSGKDNSLFAFCEMLKQKAPDYFNLLTAKSTPEFEAAFDALLEKAVSGLEQNKRKFETLDEDGLSSALPSRCQCRVSQSRGKLILMAMLI